MLKLFGKIVNFTHLNSVHSTKDLPTALSIGGLARLGLWGNGWGGGGMGGGGMGKCGEIIKNDLPKC